jgi:hypothetical protein
MHVSAVQSIGTVNFGEKATPASKLAGRTVAHAEGPTAAKIIGWILVIGASLFGVGLGYALGGTLIACVMLAPAALGLGVAISNIVGTLKKQPEGKPPAAEPFTPPKAGSTASEFETLLNSLSSNFIDKSRWVEEIRISSEEDLQKAVHRKECFQQLFTEINSDRLPRNGKLSDGRTYLLIGVRIEEKGSSLSGTYGTFIAILQTAQGAATYSLLWNQEAIGSSKLISSDKEISTLLKKRCIQNTWTTSDAPWPHTSCWSLWEPIPKFDDAVAQQPTFKAAVDKLGTVTDRNQWKSAFFETEADLEKAIEHRANAEAFYPSSPVVYGVLGNGRAFVALKVEMSRICHGASLDDDSSTHIALVAQNDPNNSNLELARDRSCRVGLFIEDLYKTNPAQLFSDLLEKESIRTADEKESIQTSDMRRANPPAPRSAAPAPTQPAATTAAAAAAARPSSSPPPRSGTVAPSKKEAAKARMERDNTWNPKTESALTKLFGKQPIPAPYIAPEGFDFENAVCHDSGSERMLPGEDSVVIGSLLDGRSFVVQRISITPNGGETVKATIAILQESVGTNASWKVYRLKETGVYAYLDASLTTATDKEGLNFFERLLKEKSLTTSTATFRHI